MIKISIIEQKRKEKGMTQSDVAKECGVDRSTVAKWELGKAFPRYGKLQKLSALFNCPVSELVEGWRDG